MEELRVSYAGIRGERRVWRSAAEGADTCLVFLDGEIYLQAVGAPSVVERVAPSVSSLYVSFGEVDDRRVDFGCSAKYAAFLVEAVMPLIAAHSRIVLCGLSLSGLQAAYAFCEGAFAFSGVLCQSPSAWWQEEWLASHIRPAGGAAGRIWLSVGDRETEENVVHQPGDLVQRTSQLDSCRRLAGSLVGAGYECRFDVFAGGHDGSSWAADLARALPWLLG